MIPHNVWNIKGALLYALNMMGLLQKIRSKSEVKINIQNNQKFNAIFDEMCLSNDREFSNTQYA